MLRLWRQDVLNDPAKVQHGGVTSDGQHLTEEIFSTIALMFLAADAARNKEVVLQHFVRHSCSGTIGFRTKTYIGFLLCTEKNHTVGFLMLPTHRACTTYDVLNFLLYSDHSADAATWWDREGISSWALQFASQRLYDKTEGRLENQHPKNDTASPLNFTPRGRGHHFVVLKRGVLEKTYKWLGSKDFLSLQNGGVVCVNHLFSTPLHFVRRYT